MSDESTRPRILRLTDPTDAAEFEALVADPRVVRYDTYRDQIGDLLQTRQPGRTFRNDELAHAVDTELFGQEVYRAGVWVHYPWSHRIVHVLDAAGFIELRTSRNRYKITAEEQETLAQKRVGVVGLSVGQSVAITLALERSAGELRLADFDHVDLANLNRLRTGIHDIGVSKVAVAARQILEIDPFLAVRSFGDGLTDANLDAFMLGDGQLDLIVDECDDLAMKFTLRARARELGIPVVMDTSDRGLIDIERFDREPERPLFHGLVESIEPDRLRRLESDEKIPLIADIVGRSTMSSRAAASLLEIGQTIRTWPQLASAVTLGGGVACDVVRRILLGDLTVSGRFFVDLESTISDTGGDHRVPARVTTRQSARSTPPDGSPCAPRAPRAPRAPLAPLATRAPWNDLIAAAVHAPSGGNCQPWRFLTERDRIWVLHDRSRSASLLDFEDTAALAALGAATENLVLAAHAAALPATVATFPVAAPRQGCVARIDLAGADTESRAFDDLHAAIRDRHTNRRVGDRQRLSTDAVNDLRAAAASVPGCSLLLVDDEPRLAEIGDILGIGDRVRFLDEQLHREMMAEVRWTPDEARRTRDGIDVDTLELSGADRVGLEICRSFAPMRTLREFGGGFALARAARKAVAGASAVALVVVDGITSQHFFAGGRAMQRTWLTAHTHGLAVQPLSALPYLFARLARSPGSLPDGQRDELRGLRERYGEVFDVSATQGEVLLLRIGHAEPATVRSLRRSVADVTENLDGTGDYR